MRTFRAATLNIWSRFGPWEERLVAIREALRTLAPDVIGMQEVLRFEGMDQAALVSEGLGYHVAWGRASENHGFPVGNAILSRWPIVRSETITLPNGGTDEDRSLVFAELGAPFGKLPFFVTHLNWKFHHGHVRQLQVRAIAEHVARLAPVASFPPVLTGDFNAEPDSDEMRFMRGLATIDGESVYFADCYGLAGGGGPGSTFSRKNVYAATVREPDRRIDYVYVRGPDPRGRGEPLDAHVCFDSPTNGVWPSDHFGVLAKIAVEG